VTDEGLCMSCAMTRDQRMQYPDNCPMNFPAHGCPFYEGKRTFRGVPVVLSGDDLSLPEEKASDTHGVRFPRKG
jgi:hypothetical protein